VDADTGEVRVPRLLGVFAAGRIVSPAQARSQLIGGMTMGLSMALHEESAMDPQFGDYPNHDLAGYHIAAHADVQDIDAVWIDEEEPDLGPAGPRESARWASWARPPPSPARCTTPPGSGSATCRSGSTSC
jgi:xanthine dehydrogenase YagR molybdenum-binding subunit